MELLPHSFQTLYPVGRLDMGSTGLLILTDDGELAHKLTHPRFGVEKSYLVTLAGQPDEKTLDRATRGIVVDGERLAVEDVEILGRRRQSSASLAEGGPASARSATAWSRRSPKGEGGRAKVGRPDRKPADVDPRSERTRLRATLRRGKNREIRRLFEALGFPVIDLHRESIGSLSVRGIPPGGFRPLSLGEVELLSRRPRAKGRASGAFSRRGSSGPGGPVLPERGARGASRAEPSAQSGGGGAPPH
jgi:pseudouridine synthase